MAGGDFTQGHQLVGVGVAAGRQGQAGREAERALLHGLGQEPLHGGQLVGRGSAFVVPHPDDPDSGVSGQRRDVDRGALAIVAAAVAL